MQGGSDGFMEQNEKIGKLKSQGDKACFAERKGGFYLSDQRELVAPPFLGSMGFISGRTMAEGSLLPLLSFSPL